VCGDELLEICPASTLAPSLAFHIAEQVRRIFLSSFSSISLVLLSLT